jgi:uncharacterized protein YecE (DUF72 family)
MSRNARRSRNEQASLFELGPSAIEAAVPKPEHQQLAASLPKSTYLGTMSWSFPGWRGLLYAADTDPKQLAADGLVAYAKHPLLTAVEIDRTYYEPIAAAAFRHYASQVPDDFRFLVKAHEGCTVRRFPMHPRYGKQRGESNSLYLDCEHALAQVVAPAVEGLGSKLGALLFQFPPQDAGDPRRFAAELHAFLARLPRGVPIAVELRNAELLTLDYAAALTDTGVVHCHNVWGQMPALLTQAKRLPAATRRPLVVRWLMRRGLDYETARVRYAPFDRLAEPDPLNREAIAMLVAKAAHFDVPALVLVDNKAEGCSPESVVALARRIVEKRA